MASPPAAERNEEHPSEAEHRALEPNRSALISLPGCDGCKSPFLGGESRSGPVRIWGELKVGPLPRLRSLSGTATRTSMFGLRNVPIQFPGKPGHE